MEFHLLFKALIETQRRIQKEVDGFMFNLGFSGGFFLSGDDDEDVGDKELLGLYLYLSLFCLFTF